MRNFPTVHCHPSSLDSGSTPETFAEREVELGTGVITCTDHGSLAACRKIYDLGKENGLVPVLGLEAYLRDDGCNILTEAGYPKNERGAFIGAPKYMHVTLGFQDQAAYECAIRLLSNADERLDDTLLTLEPDDRKHGSERKPLFKWADFEELGAHNTTITSGCMIGAVQRHLLDNNDGPTAIKYFEKLKGLTKPGNFYVELNPHDTSKNWASGIFVTIADGTRQKFHAKKWLMTNVGEIQAKALAKVWGSEACEHRVLKAIKNYSTWTEMPEVEILKVEHIEDYLDNEPCNWAPNGDYQAGLNRYMRLLARRYNVPIVVGDDSHYAKPEESIVQDVRLAQSGTWRFYGSYERKSSADAFTHFSHTLGTTEAEFEGWVDNAYAWADKFKGFVFDSPVSLPTKFYEASYELRPWYKPGDHDNSLRYVFELIKKHGRMSWNKPEYAARLKAEIALLHNNGTIDLLPYFLIDEEICAYYESLKLLTGPGRGSAAGLLLTYLLGITHVDPLRYELSMDRFITKDRIQSGKLPDIDQDLPKAHRRLLIDPKTGWLKKRFGDHYAKISVDTKLKLRSAVLDVARARRRFIDPQIAAWTKKFIEAPQGVDDFDFVMGYESDGEGHVQGSIEYDPALRQYVAAYPEDWSVVQRCLGLTRQKGQHACAFVIANRPIHEFIPLTTVSGDRVTAYTATSVEAVGGLKMDFLGLGALNDLGDAINLIQARSGVTVPEQTILGGVRVPGHRLVTHQGKLLDIWDLPEDQAVFEDVALGRTETVFQYNTPGAVQWLQQFAYRKPSGTFAIDSIESMGAFTALDRPGPLDMMVPNPDSDDQQHNLLVEYARRARGAEPSTGILPIFDQFIPETYGVMVYQEQLQRMYQQLTGCSGADAEEFRSNVAKKKKSKIEKAYGPFIEKASQQIGKENAEASWAFFLTWAKYGFNKSHSTCYAVIGYACAYLKHHFPLEWWTAVLRNADKKEVNEKFWRYCGKLIDLPDVKKSTSNFEINKDERIQAPLNLLHGIGEIADKQLNAGAPYTDIDDFCRKIEKHKIDTGEWTTKTVTKKVCAIDPATKKRRKDDEGNFVKEDRTEVKKTFKKGRSALHRGIVQTLIMSGAMDSLFPLDTTLSHQLTEFERALVDSEHESALKLATELGAVRLPKKKKQAAVDPATWNIGPVKRYQVKKGILPAFSTDLVPLISIDPPRGFVNDEAGPRIRWRPPRSSRFFDVDVVSAATVESLASRSLDEDETITVAVAAYVDDTRTWSFGEESREACELQLDVEGARFKFIRWAGKAIKLPPIFKEALKGAIVIAVLNKWSSDRPFGIEDIIVVVPPVGQEPEPPEEEENPDSADEGESEDSTTTPTP